MIRRTVFDSIAIPQFQKGIVIPCVIYWLLI